MKAAKPSERAPQPGAVDPRAFDLKSGSAFQLGAAGPTSTPRKAPGRGAKKFVATEDQRKFVAMCCAVGWPQEQIAKLINWPGPGIDQATLQRHFRHELDDGLRLVNLQVSNALFRMATSNHRQAHVAAIFWLKARAGWRTEDQPDSGNEGSISAGIDGKVHVTISISTSGNTRPETRRRIESAEGEPEPD